MKKIRNKILILLSCLIFVSSCHTLEHNGFKINLVNNLTAHKKSNDDIFKINKKNLMPEKESTDSKKVEKKPKIIKKTSVNLITNKPQKSEIIKFNPKSVLNLSEEQLFKKLGKSNFIKHEGKLKNHQYYFPNCFVDIFAIKKEGKYLVDLFQRRPIKLNGFLNEESCYADISKKIKSLEQ